MKSLSTFRARMTVGLGALTLTVVVLGVLMAWGRHQTDLHLRRSHAVQAQLATYLSVAADVQRYVRRVTRIPAPHSERASEDQELLRRLDRRLDELEYLVEDEYVLDPSKATGRELEQLRRLGRLREIVAQMTTIIESPADLENHRIAVDRWQSLTAKLETAVDIALRRELDAAIADERSEVAEVIAGSRALTQRLAWIAGAATAAATLLAVLLGVGLFRSMQRPINALLRGTERFAEGELDYRVTPGGVAEFARLAAGFNRMAEELSSQHRALLAAQSDLEQKVRERTQRLRDTNEQLRRIDQTRRQFLADVSHELRTPLTVIRGEADVTAYGGRKRVNDYEATLARISELSAHMGRLVDGLLSVARSESVSTEGDVCDFALDELLEELVASGRALATQHSLTMTHAFADRAVWIRGSPQRIRQLLMNLIDNACRYTPAGGEIMILLEQDGNEAVISVSDTGIGIESADLNQVFERTFRSAEARSMAPDGAGFGLTLARAIAYAHHGSVRLTSTTDAGTTATVRLPLAQKQADQRASAAG
ncbi:MAG: sensor histidine kinase [Gammaproteobacteria bacterium]